jgi:hypothetical protein
MSTLAPSTEAVNAIVARINAGTAYNLDLKAEARELIVDPTEEVTELRVDVCHESEQQLFETLDSVDNTQHAIRIWIRKKVADITPQELNPLRLLCRQILRQVDQYVTTDWRVRVWQAGFETQEVADKAVLYSQRMFVASISCEVQVKP